MFSTRILPRLLFALAALVAAFPLLGGCSDPAAVKIKPSLYSGLVALDARGAPVAEYVALFQAPRKGDDDMPNTLVGCSQAGPPARASLGCSNGVCVTRYTCAGGDVFFVFDDGESLVIVGPTYRG